MLIGRFGFFIVPQARIDFNCFYGGNIGLGYPDDPGNMWLRPDPGLDDIWKIFSYALTVDGYHYALEHFDVHCGTLANQRLQQYQETGEWEGSFEELRCCLFFEQRRYRHFGRGPEGEEYQAIQDLYKAICERWEPKA